MKTEKSEHMNQWVLVGVLAKDPETRFTKNNNAYTKARILVTTGSGEYQKTNSFGITGWRQMSDKLSSFRAGALIKVTGKASISKFNDKHDGSERWDMQNNIDHIEDLNKLSVNTNESESQTDFGIGGDRYVDDDPIPF
jgi:single-strand DNA-binding protein